jgi:hypothetical protein
MTRPANIELTSVKSAYMLAYIIDRLSPLPIHLSDSHKNQKPRTENMNVCQLPGSTSSSRLRYTESGKRSYTYLYKMYMSANIEHKTLSVAQKTSRIINQRKQLKQLTGARNAASGAVPLRTTTGGPYS